MPQLLLSVQDDREYDLVRQLGAPWIDVKDTAKGSLGRPSVVALSTVLRAASLWPAGAPAPVLSVALGELFDPQPTHLDAYGALLRQVDFVKVGLSQGTRTAKNGDENWRDAWHELRRRIQTLTTERFSDTDGESFSKSPQLVPVYYADHQLANSPSFTDILELAVEAGSPLVLIDTFDKSAGSLRRWVDHDWLVSAAEAVHRPEIALVLAGSLTLDDMRWIGQLPMESQPAIMAVRSAACVGGDRTGKLSPERIEQLIHMVATQAIH
jgi:uncharacterized protein (UPF0264 family)